MVLRSLQQMMVRFSVHCHNAFDLTAAERGYMEWVSRPVLKLKDVSGLQ